MKSSILAILMVSFGCSLQASDYFNFLEDSPELSMNLPPQKSSEDFQDNFPQTKFSREEILSSRYVEIKNRFRARMMLRSRQAFLDANPVTETFTDKSNLLELESHGLTSGQVAVPAWSGDYWASYRGGIGSRYNHPLFTGDSWQDNWLLYQKFFPIDLSVQDNLRYLSPAEKYDLLMGHSNHNLTKWAWQESKNSENTDGDVEMWFGLCHGWSAAAVMMDRPKQMISMSSKDGKYNLEFFPDDLKALASQTWATARFETDFVGGRCNEKSPAIDPETGRVIDPECRDVGPALWHSSVTKLIGKQRTSFVMDATYDYEVWNQPLHSYTYRYFNPENKKLSETLDEAAMPISQVKNDRFRKFRNPNTKFLVGISMHVTYVVETSASDSETDDESKDRRRSVEYVYDLELDQNFNVIGGEWHINMHPDFLWKPAAGTIALSNLERYQGTTNWSPQTPVSENLSKQSEVSANRGQVRWDILKGLFNQSQKDN